MMNLQIFPKKDLATTLKSLKKLSETIGQQHLTQFFKTDEKRFENFSIQCDEIVFDYSKQRIDQSVIQGYWMLLGYVICLLGLNAYFLKKPLITPKNVR